MTKRDLFIQLLGNFADSCIKNDISVVVVACYKDKDSVVKSASFVHACEKEILVPAMVKEMEIDPHLDSYIKCASGRLKSLRA